MLAHNLIAGLNWAIEKDDALHEALKALAGRHLRLMLPANGHLDCVIEADGLLKRLSLGSVGAQHEPAHQPDVTIELGADSSRGIRIAGNAAVAEKLGPLSALIKARIAPLEQALKASPASLLARQAADYAIHEAQWVVSREHAEAHHQSLRNLRDAVDRLEKRIDQLARVRSL